MWPPPRLSVRRTLELACTAVLLTTCAYNFAMTPYFECLLLWGGNCTERSHRSPLTGMYSRSTSVSCFASVAIGWSRYRGAAAAIGARLRIHDEYSPTSAVEARGHTLFGAAVLVACALLIVPVNVIRLTEMTTLERRPVQVLVYYSLTYVHNVVSCLWECRFIALCYVLYTKFAKLNRDMEAIGRRIVDPDAADNDHERHADDPGVGDRCLDGTAANHYRWMKNHNDEMANRSDLGHLDGGGSDDYDDDDDKHKDKDDEDVWVAEYDDRGDYVYRSRATGQPLVEAVERLKIRHRLIREAANELKYAFAVPVGASLCNLGVMALFDIYELATANTVQETGQKRITFIVLWLTQYAFRFFAIVAIADATTNQAFRSKLIVSFVNKHFLDIATKEELQVFFCQITSPSLEFTIYDLFSLKTELFTSAIGACLTYLIFLLQMKSSNEEIKPTTP